MCLISVSPGSDIALAEEPSTPDPPVATFGSKEAAVSRSARERVLAVLVLLAASTVATGDEAVEARPELVVLWSDPQHAVPEAARRDLVRETEELFARWGVALATSWEDCDQATTRQVRVVLLGQERLAHGGKNVLGETNVKPLEFPAVWILVPNVREILERKGWRSSPPVLARALSRVAAHEIVHALGLGHARRGLMRRGLAADDLTGPWVQLDDAFRRALLEALGRSHLQPMNS